MGLILQISTWAQLFLYPEAWHPEKCGFLDVHLRALLSSVGVEQNSFLQLGKLFSLKNFTDTRISNLSHWCFEVSKRLASSDSCLAGWLLHSAALLSPSLCILPIMVPGALHYDFLDLPPGWVSAPITSTQCLSHRHISLHVKSVKGL